METQALIPQNSSSRRAINFLKNVRLINILTKKINACRKVEINFIAKNAGFKNTDVVLDIGSGDGYWTNYFGKMCFKMFGIEPYEEHYQIAKKNYSNECSFYLSSAESLNFLPESFDKVISVCVFEHLYNDMAAFKEIYKVLKPGGKLLATADSLSSKHISESHRKKHIKECYCAQLYTVEELSNKLSEAGFQNINAHYIIGSKLGIFYEMLSEKIGAVSYFLLLSLYPVILFMEREFKTSGYKIFVEAEK